MTSPAAVTVTPMTTRQRGTLVATGIGLFMIFLDALIVNVALPDIGAAFGTGESGLQWTVTAYSLAMAVSMMTFAAVADRWGRRRLYVGGLVVFGTASVACGLAPTIEVLNAARGVQGLAAAAVNVTSLALVSAAFTDAAAKARAIGIWAAIAATGVAVGPTVGGLFTQAFGWRSVFFVNVPFAVVAVVVTVRYVAESRDPRARSFDLPGQALYIAAVGGFAFAVIEGPQRGWASGAVLVAFAVFLVALPLFVVRERRTLEPMMDLHLFGDRTYTLAIVTIFVAMFAVYGMLLVVDQLWQEVRGDSVLATGLRLVPLAVTQVVLSPVAGRWVGRLGARRVMLSGLGLLCLAFAVLVVGARVGDGVTALGATIVGAGLALTMTAATTVAMATVPDDRAGMASGIMSSQRALGSTAGYAVLGSVLAAWLAGTVGPSLQTTVPDRAEREAVARVIVEQANPRANVAELLPAPTRPGASGVTPAAVAAAAEDDVRSGIQLALGVALLVLLATLVADWRGIPGTTPSSAPGSAGGGPGDAPPVDPEAPEPGLA